MNVKIIGNPYEFEIRCRNRFDRNSLKNVFHHKYHRTESIFVNKPNPVILDLGANIGLTIIDYKQAYPGAKIFGYEMDADNFKVAIENCKNLSDVDLTNKAIWINNGTMTYNKLTNSDAYSLSDTANATNIIVETISMSQILVDKKISKVDFIKMDIEGAEVHILRNNLEWLDHVNSLNIEFHDIDINELKKFVAIIEGYGFNAWQSKNHWLAIEAVKRH